MLALLVDDPRGQQHEPDALLLEHGLGDLLHRLTLDRPAAAVAVRAADAGEQQPEVVVYLRHGADGRPRVVGHPLLVDGDRRGEPFDVLDVGLVHAAEELAGIGRQRFDVPPLAFGVDGVEGERRLARPGRARDDDELVSRDRDVDVLEVVFACAFDDDVFEGHRVLERDDLGSAGPPARDAGPACDDTITTIARGRARRCVRTRAGGETMRRCAPRRAPGPTRGRPAPRSRRRRCRR